MKSVWIKSSLSLSNGNCVEVTELRSGGVGVRNSRYTEEPVLQFTADEWHAFLGGVRNGEFDSFGGTASSVGAGLARDVASLRDDPRDHVATAPHLPSCTRASERDATRLLSVSRIEQAGRGDMSCLDRASPGHHVTSRLRSRSTSGDEADKSSHPGKNRQMLRPRHGESGDA
jgi:Domain of unknown function (DUF397)